MHSSRSDDYLAGYRCAGNSPPRLLRRQVLISAAEVRHPWLGGASYFHVAQAIRPDTLWDLWFEATVGGKAR
jgi:hypothetical protein